MRVHPDSEFIVAAYKGVQPPSAPTAAPWA